MMNRLIVLTALLLGLVTSAAAATGFAFLEIPVGAREGALGGAGVALVSGPGSATFNPASVAFSERGSVVLMTNRRFGDTRTQFFGATLKGRRCAISPHFWGTRVSDIEYREQPTSEPISTFDATNAAVGASFAARIHPKLAFGLTGHYLYHKIHVESSDGWATDLGVHWRTPLKGLSVASALNHLGRVTGFIDEDVQLPTTFRSGAAYERVLTGVGTILFTAEGAAVTENTPIYRGGIEYRAPQFVAIRAGYVEGLEAQGVSVGLGLSHRGIRIDYAFIPFKEELGEGHRFSFGLNL